MISVLLLGSSVAARRPATAGDAVRTLSALVAGAVDGVVQDVQLLATGTGPDLTRVAEHAGCGFVAAADLAGALARAVPQARSPDLLMLQAGVSFDRTLTDEIAGVTGRHAPWLNDGIALKAVESGILGRLVPRLAPTVGVLIARDRLLAVKAVRTADLWRRLRPRRAFATRAWVGE